METEKKILFSRINEAKTKALSFLDKLRIEDGYKYTVNHNPLKYPAAVLYGTWSVAHAKHLLLGQDWTDADEKAFVIKSLNFFRQKDGTYFPKSLETIKPAKSIEYLKLHCSNYAMGAAVSIDHSYDFQSSYFDLFLDPDFLSRWLEQRSFSRPWEESNNIVNVASYLALCNDKGNSKGKERLYQMLEWHNKYQNSKTGGFDNFSHSRKNILQSMAGAVHNFHIHHYLGEPMNYEQVIASNVVSYLFEGPLTACLSIDFTELGCKTISYLDNSFELEQALLYHLNALLDYQNPDGGWNENENASLPTSANGMKEDVASSNSYATWFRLCSIGMIMIVLLGDKPENWSFRSTLGMGYAHPDWKAIQTKSLSLEKHVIRKYKLQNIPNVMKNKLIKLASKFIS